MTSSSKSVTLEDRLIGKAASLVNEDEESEYNGWSEYINDLVKGDLEERGKL